ncbi:MAG: hypothetical protein U1F67_08805 [Rubrivivax sp.]
MTRPTPRLLAPLRLVLALVILFEEWGWEPLQRGAHRAAAATARRVEHDRPRAALQRSSCSSCRRWRCCRCRIGALWLVAHGQKLLGVLVIAAAKVVGTALMARLFTLTQPALMRLPWFAALYGRWSAWKEALLAWVRSSAVWRTMRAWRRQWRERLRRWRAG